MTEHTAHIVYDEHGKPDDINLTCSHCHLEAMSLSEWCLILDRADTGQQVIINLASRTPLHVMIYESDVEEIPHAV